MNSFIYPLCKKFPEHICDLFKTEACFMHNDLVNNRLVVKLVNPECFCKDGLDGYSTHQGHKLRAVENENPIWYKKVCNEVINPLMKKGDCFSRIRHVNSLKRISMGQDKKFESGNFRYRWDLFYRELIFKRLTEGFECMEREVSFNEKARDYFIGLGLVKEEFEEVPF